MNLRNYAYKTQKPWVVDRRMVTDGAVPEGFKLK